MKNLLFTAACLLALASCQNSGSTDTESTTAVDSTAIAPIAAEPATPQTMCYLHAEGKDSTTASVTIAADGTVTGSYDWTPWQKDGAHGTLTGKKEGDLLRVMYDYTIEGSNQQEEKIFKLTGDQLQEGEGELTEGEGGVLKIKDATKLNWKPLTKVECK